MVVRQNKSAPHASLRGLCRACSVGRLLFSLLPRLRHLGEVRMAFLHSFEGLHKPLFLKEIHGLAGVDGELVGDDLCKVDEEALVGDVEILPRLGVLDADRADVVRLRVDRGKDKREEGRARWRGGWEGGRRREMKGGDVRIWLAGTAGLEAIETSRSKQPWAKIEERRGQRGRERKASRNQIQSMKSSIMLAHDAEDDGRLAAPSDARQHFAPSCRVET